MPKFLEVTDVPAAKSYLDIAEVNVADHGATGNGTTDDTTAIHLARTAAGTGGKLHFPAGTYLVSGLTASIADQTWQLSSGATIKMAAGAASVLAITGQGVTIVGGIFDGSNGTVNDWSQQGIKVTADDVTLRDLEVRNSPAHGVYALNCDRVTITNCRFIDSYWAGVIIQNSVADSDLYDMTVTGNHVESSLDTGYGIGVTGGVTAATLNMPIHRVIVSGNTIILPVDPSEESSCIGLSGCTDWVISDNILRGASLGISCPRPVRATITNNQVRGFNQMGIEIPGNLTDCLVSDNIIDALAADGAYGSASGIHHSQGTVDGLTIVGNEIFGFDGDMSGIGFGSGSVVRSASVCGNVIRGDCNKYYGVSVSNTVKNLTVSGNTFDAGVIATNIRAIFFSGNGTSSNVVVAGNVFTSTSSASANYAMFFDVNATIAGLTFTGNTIKSPSSVGFATLYMYSPTSNAVITGNSVDASGSTFSNGVELYNSVDGLTVSGNQFSNFTESVMRLQASTAVTMQNIKVGGNSITNVPHRIRNLNSGGAVVAASVFSTDEYVPGVTSTATAAGTTTLTRDSTEVQVFTGSTTQTCQLATTYVPAGHKFTVVNNSTGSVTVTASGGATITTVPPGGSNQFTAVQATPTTAAHWTATVSANPSVATLKDTNGATAFEVGLRASAVNYLRTLPGATGQLVSLSTVGSDTNVPLSISSKGSSLIYVSPGGQNGLQVGHTASAVNYLRISGGATGGGPTLSASGSDTNVDMLLTTKGAGVVKANGNPVGVKVAVPANASATGVVGQWAAESGWLYICVAANTWERVAIASW